MEKKKEKNKLRCLEKHQSSETCLRKTEILMLTVKSNSMEQRGSNKDKASSRYYESKARVRKPSLDIQITSTYLVRNSDKASKE